MSDVLTPEEFQRQTGVSRETLERLKAYAELLVKWNDRINLVAESTLGDLWRRHMLDSAQLFPLLPKVSPGHRRVLVDLGSGAGFPGMVLSVLGAGDVHLVDSDQRKAIFLREVAREVGSDAHIHAVRIEQMREFAADVVTARALAPLGELLELAEPFLRGGGCALFLKGKTAKNEVAEAELHWSLRTDYHKSLSDPSGVVLQIGVYGRETVRH